MWEANQKYVSLTRHTWEAVNLTFGATFWKGLTAEQQAVIEEAGAIARDQMRNEVQSSEQDYIQRLRDEGVTVTEVNLDDFKAAMAPAWDRVAEYEGSADDMATFLAMVEDVKP
jgi:TRAP-type C4-dicarboxylate transport system substrate-binding protein